MMSTSGSMLEEAMADTGDEKFEKILTANLQRAIDFLKYAEAKNAALLTLTSGWTLAIIALLAGEKPLKLGLDSGFPRALPFIVVAGLLSLASFLPRTDLHWFVIGKKPGERAKNLLFFDDIASLTIAEFEKQLSTRYKASDPTEFSQHYLHDLTTQISVNSSITCHKLRLFKWALRSLALSAGILIVHVVCSLF